MKTKPNRVEKNGSSLTAVSQPQICPEKPVRFSPEQCDALYHELKSDVRALNMAEDILIGYRDRMVYLQELSRIALIHGSHEDGSYSRETRACLENGAVLIENHCNATFKEGMQLMGGTRTIIEEFIEKMKHKFEPRR